MEKPLNWKEMDDAAHARARDFAARGLNILRLLINEMRLTRGEAALAFAYLLAESVSHYTTKNEREFAARQFQEIITAAAEDFVETRRVIRKPN